MENIQSPEFNSLPVQPPYQISAPISRPTTLRKMLLAVGSFILLASTFVSGYYFGTLQNQAANFGEKNIVTPPSATQNATECTLEAMLCPDGTSVGRTGPNCEFAECPAVAESSQSEQALVTYSNDAYGYSFQYPESWKVTTEDYISAAGPSTKAVYIFNPDDNPQESFYSGMKIEYVGMLLTLPEGDFTNINGADMISQETPHGIVYYALIPGTDQLLEISGAGGNTANEATNQGVREIFNSFRFKHF
jgi:hypothetical protein